MGCHVEKGGHTDTSWAVPLILAISSHLLTIKDGSEPEQPKPGDEPSYASEEDDKLVH
jgi:hypothetical protein